MQGALAFPPKVSLPLRQSHRRRRMPVSAAAVAEVAQPPDRRCLYDVLQVKQDASQVEIKSAYRALAKLYHPDVMSSSSSSDGRDFVEIRKAYSTLSDPQARAVYDLKMTMDSGSRRNWCSDVSRGGERVHRTQRWETDQCW